MRRRIVLLGGGHAHALVLARWAKAPPDAHVTLVSDTPRAIYSGMVPGVVAGDYAPEDAVVDLAALAKRAGAQLVAQPALALDTAGRRLILPHASTLPYDVLSIDVGSTVVGLDLPGVREHALATRPIAGFLAAIVPLVARLAARGRDDPARIAIAGGGVAGVELALTLRARLVRAAGVEPRIAVIEPGPALFGGRARRLARLASRACAERGISLRFGARIEAVEASAVRLADGSVLETDATLWATGAAPFPWLRAASVAHDERGFVRVRETLQCVGDEAVFVAGDAASLGAGGLPKSGVYAVRAAPVLARNLEAVVVGGRLRGYRPQRDALVLLNAGDRIALGGKWGLAVAGPWVWGLKDRIDRRFVASLR